MTRFQKDITKIAILKNKSELKWSTKDSQITQNEQEKRNEETNDMENKQIIKWYT